MSDERIHVVVTVDDAVVVDMQAVEISFSRGAPEPIHDAGGIVGYIKDESVGISIVGRLVMETVGRWA